MIAPILGIDVAKKTLDVVLLREGRAVYRQWDNQLSGYQHLCAWLAQQQVGPVHACLEATGQYGEGVAAYLFDQGHSVSVVNPARIKHYANSQLRRNKTDKADAHLIAQYCLREHPALWTPPPASFQQLQALIRHLDDLLSTRLQTTNRLGSGVRTALVVAQLQQLVAFLDGQIAHTRQAIQAQIDQSPELQHAQALLITIPGIGRLTAARLLGEVRSLLAFENARQLAAYAGVTPRVFLSGTSVHKKSRLAKTGNAHLRKALYMPAISAKRWNPIVRTFCERLTQSGHQPMEVICAAMHKLLHLAYGVLKSDIPFDPDYLVHRHATT